MATFDISNFDRRGFLRLLSGGALTLASGGLLTGCGGGGGGSQAGGTASTAPTTQPLSGTINISQVGGSGLLVQSVYQTDTAVSSNGVFSTTVSAQGAHLLAVTDNNGDLRALGLSMPGAATGATALAVAPNTATRDAAMPTIDATSTAVCIIFLTPGIAATTPTDAATRTTQIQGLTSFTPLASYLSNNLASSTLPSLIQAGTLTNLAYTCVQEWQNTYSPASQTGQARPHVSDGESFTADFAAGATNAVPVKFSNGEFRYVNVVRRYVNSSDSDIGNAQQTYDWLVGAAAVSISDLLNADIAKPNDDGTDTVDLTTQNINAVEYWVRGPGIGSTENLPASVSAFSDDIAIGASLMLYLIIPLLDAALSLDGAFEGNAIYKDLANAWANDNPGIDTASIFVDIANGDKGKALVDALISIITYVPLQKALLNVLKNNLGEKALISLGVEQVFKVLGFISQVFDIMTVLIVIGSWSTYSRASKISLPANGLEVTVQ